MASTILDEAAAKQHGLPAAALATTLCALQRCTLATLAAGRGVGIPRIGRFVWATAPAVTAGTAPPPSVHQHTQQRAPRQSEGEQLLFQLSDALVHAGHLRLGVGLARATAPMQPVEDVNLLQIAG